MPGCRRRAVTCDLDHTIAWPTGSTEASNLGPLCRRHHRLKTHFRFDLQPDLEPDRFEPDRPDRSDPEGPGAEAPGPGWEWTMPTGLTYRDTPTPPLDP